MKANELMIGDWVASRKWIEKPFKLITLSERKGDFFYGRTSENSIVGPFFVESFEPIPLTPEILEKNGFKRVRDKLGRVFYSIADDYFDLTIDEITDSIWCIEYDNLEAQFLTCRNLVAHVHELQHALKLYGINKEIIL